MWQKARIIDQDFRPIRHVGRELWIKDLPFDASFSILCMDNLRVMPKPDEGVIYTGKWMLTNLGFSSGTQVRIWKDSIEMLAEFAETVPLVDVNSDEIILYAIPER